MPPEDDNSSQTGDGGQEPEEPSFEDLVQAAITGCRFKDGIEGSTGFWEDVSGPEDLLADGASDHISALREGLGPRGAELADTLTGLADAAFQKKEEVEHQRLASDREAMKAALKKELADQAVTAARTAEEQRVREELLGEIAAEDAAATGEPTTGPGDAADAAYARFAALKKSGAPRDEVMRAADEAIEARRVADEEIQFTLNRDALAAAAEAKLKKIRGE